MTQQVQGRAALGIARRVAGHLARGVIMIWVVATISFVVIRMIPGDPVMGQYESLIQKGMSPEQAERATAVLYGFLPTGSLWEQYLGYLGSLLRFDLGRSLSTPGVEVTTLIGSAARWTVLPVLAGTLLSFLLGIVLGVYAAIKRSGSSATCSPSPGRSSTACPCTSSACCSPRSSPRSGPSSRRAARWTSSTSPG